MDIYYHSLLFPMQIFQIFVFLIAEYCEYIFTNKQILRVSQVFFWARYNKSRYYVWVGEECIWKN